MDDNINGYILYQLSEGDQLDDALRSVGKYELSRDDIVLSRNEASRIRVVQHWSARLNENTGRIFVLKSQQGVQALFSIDVSSQTFENILVADNTDRRLWSAACKAMAQLIEVYEIKRLPKGFELGAYEQIVMANGELRPPDAAYVNEALFGTVVLSKETSEDLAAAALAHKFLLCDVTDMEQVQLDRMRNVEASLRHRGTSIVMRNLRKVRALIAPEAQCLVLPKLYEAEIIGCSHANYIAAPHLARVDELWAESAVELDFPALVKVRKVLRANWAVVGRFPVLEELGTDSEVYDRGVYEAPKLAAECWDQYRTVEHYTIGGSKERHARRPPYTVDDFA